MTTLDTENAPAQVQRRRPLQPGAVPKGQDSTAVRHSLSHLGTRRGHWSHVQGHYRWHWQQQAWLLKNLEFCGKQAKHDDLHYFWVDTCCIDKSNHSELAIAINSMFRWYENAERCYVYLLDVSVYARDRSEHVDIIIFKYAKETKMSSEEKLGKGEDLYVEH